MEEQPFGQVRIGRNEAGSHGIGGRVDVIVVESGGGEVVSGQDNGSEGEGAGADEGDPGGGRLGRSRVLGEDGELKVAELEVVGKVRENIQMVKRVFKGRAQEGGEMALQEALGLATQPDEL